MSKLKRVKTQIKDIYKTKPWLFVIVVAIVSLLISISFEYFRAKTYLNKAEDYKNSATIVGIKALADEISSTAEESEPAILCNIDHTSLLGENNEAYKSSNDRFKNLLRELNNSAKIADKPPAFSSLHQFVPTVKDARTISQEMHTALDELINLTELDLRSSYCESLVDVLREVYFLSVIENPEGVSALLVGQLENLQVNTEQSIDIWAEVDPPTDFYNLHIQVGQILNSVKLNLRNDPDNYESFARAVEQDVANLDFALQQLAERAGDLLIRPSLIAIQANYLD